jgi:hypothetical protein
MSSELRQSQIWTRKGDNSQLCRVAFFLHHRDLPSKCEWLPRHHLWLSSRPAIF